MARPVDAGAQRYDYDGRSLTLREWSQDLRIPYQTLMTRLRRGWDIERTLSTPQRRPKRLRYDGRVQTVQEWADELGIPRRTIYDRLLAGASTRDALAPDDE